MLATATFGVGISVRVAGGRRCRRRRRYLQTDRECRMSQGRLTAASFSHGASMSRNVLSARSAVTAMVVLGVCLVADDAWAQAAGGRPPDAESSLSVPALVEDFDVVRRALEEAHGGFDRFSSRADIQRRLDHHRARLDRPMSVTAFAAILAEAIAELRDGHARLELDSVTAARLSGAHVFPVRVALEGERLIARWNDAAGDTVLRPGMEIRRINSRPAMEIIATLLPKVSRDGFIESGRRTRLAREFASLYWLYVDHTDRFTIEAADDGGRVVTVTLPGVLERERLAAPNPINAHLATNFARLDGPPGNITVALLPNAIARLRIRGFGGERFPVVLDSAFQLIRDRGVEKLVLDLRGNGGGVDEYGALLVSHFKERPFRYFDHIRVTSIAPSFATWLERTFAEMRAGTVPHPDAGFLVTPARD